MKYYRIQFTLNPKISGANNDTIKAYIYHGKISDPKFIGRIFFEKITFEPLLVSPVLFNKANKTDLIQNGGQLSGKMLISTKFKAILEKNDFGVQYIKSSVFHKGIEDSGYWIVNPYETLDNAIDFEASSILHEARKEDFHISYEIEKLHVKIHSVEEFQSKLNKVSENDEMLYIEKFNVKNNLITVDFFALRYALGGNFYVSEILKQEIEHAGCTGVEFQPIELSYNEWTAQGGIREQVYGRSW